MNQFFREDFRQRLSPRIHMTVLLLTTICAGVCIDRLLLWSGVRYLCLRYTLSVTLSYAVFLLLVRVWLAYVRLNFEPQEKYPDPIDTPAQKHATGSTTVGSGRWSWWDVFDFGEFFDVGEGCGWVLLVLVCLAAIVGFVIGAFVLFWDSPIILADAALEFFLAAGMIRPLKKLERPDWTLSILATTWKPFAGILAFTVVFGMIAEVWVPGAVTMHDVLQAFGR